MNERIKELIKQCTSWSEGSTWTSHEEFDKEKFAELIIRECADLIKDDDNAYDILKHFGVEL